MQSPDTLIVFLNILSYLVSLFITLVVAIYTYTRRTVTGARPFAIILFLEAIWTFGYIFELVSPSLAQKAFWDNFQNFGSYLLPVAFLPFVAAYSGRVKWLTQRRLGGLTLISILLILLLNLNPFPLLGNHSPRLIPAEPFSVYTYQFGPILYVGFIYAYLLTMTGIIILCRLFTHQKGLVRVQTGFIILGMSIPVLGTIITISGIDLFPNKDISPFTFGFANLIIALGLFRYRIFNLIPRARSSVMDYIGDPVIVLDARDVILDANPAAETLTRGLSVALVGKPLHEVLPSMPVVDDSFRQKELRTEIDITGNPGTRSFEVNSAPYANDLGEYTGRLLILHDMTRHKQEEIALRNSHDTLEEAIRQRTIELETANKHLLGEINERRRIEKEKTVYSLELEMLYNLAIELSDLPEETDLETYIANKLKELTHAYGVSLSDYNPQEKRLESRMLISDNSVLNQASAIIGQDVKNLYFPVSDEMYQEMTQNRVGHRKHLTEATFGSIPAGVGTILEKMFNLEHFIGLVVLNEGKLLATMMLIMQKGQEIPSDRFLYALTHITSIALKRSKSEKARRESETRFQQMADLLPQVIYECDLQGQITYTNQRGLDLFAYASLEQGIKVLDLVDPSQYESILQAMQKVLQGQAFTGHEYLAKRKDGSLFPALIYSSIIWEGDQPCGLRGVVVDISDRKQNELALRESLEKLEQSNRDLVEAYDSTLNGWSRALELRERETAGHSQRVVEMTLQLAAELKVDRANFSSIRWGAYLHDIGKIGIPDAILLKPGPLSDEEWVIMRQHPVYAHELLSSISFLKQSIDIPYSHHERWDGSGYPLGLKSEHIPLMARIFSVIDVWDALRSDRPYRPAWSEKETLEYIRKYAGIQFDPRVVDAFMKIVGVSADRG